MAFTIDHIQEIYKKGWKLKNVLGESQIAVLFPNELIQDQVGFKSKIKFPVMTEASTQKDWSQKEGFNETDSEELTVELELEKNFTSYTKISKANIPANQESWATNKMNIIETQRAEQLDEDCLADIVKGVTNFLPNPVKLTEKNFIAEIKRLERQAKEQKFLLQKALILISPEVATLIANSKLINSQNQNIENTNTIITRILNRYSTLECDIDMGGFQMIALLPSAFAWASGVETALQSGVYTQGKFLGQVFTAVNVFYNGKIIMPEHVIGMKDVNEEGKIEDKNIDDFQSLTKEGSINSLKNKTWDDLEEMYSSKEKWEVVIKKYRLPWSNAKSTESVMKLAEKIKKEVEEGNV